MANGKRGSGRGAVLRSLIVGGFAGMTDERAVQALGRAARYQVVFADGVVTLARRFDGSLRVGVRPCRAAEARAWASRFN